VYGDKTVTPKRARQASSRDPADATTRASLDECYEPVWSWDCQLKFYYHNMSVATATAEDGKVTRISGFGPCPMDTKDRPWSGDVTVFCGAKEIARKRFTAANRDALRDDVESFVNGVAKRIEAAVRAVLGRLEEEEAR
jgi:hypothetical protein